MERRDLRGDFNSEYFSGWVTWICEVEQINQGGGSLVMLAFQLASGDYDGAKGE